MMVNLCLVAELMSDIWCVQDLANWRTADGITQGTLAANMRAHPGEYLPIVSASPSASAFMHCACVFVRC